MENGYSWVERAKYHIVVRGEHFDKWKTKELKDMMKGISNQVQWRVKHLENHIPTIPVSIDYQLNQILRQFIKYVHIFGQPQ